MKFTILTIGKPKEPFVKEGIDFYEKRIKPFGVLEWIPIPEEKSTKGKTPEEIKKIEGEKLLSAVPKGSTLVVLDERGKHFSSPEFAKEIGHLRDTKGGHFTFCIGGAFGHSEKVRASAHLLISLSSLTFPHDLVKIFLLEQIYRACMIIENREYHK